MIDIHCHILPGVDDGAKTIEDSLEMAKMAVKEGIHTIIATPHHKNNRYENPKAKIIDHVNLLNEKLLEEGIPVRVLAGQESRIHGEFIEGYDQGDILPLANGKYVFVELPSSTVPRYTEKLLYDIQVQGMIPVIVHPERNQMLIENPELLYKFVNNGTLTQLTMASICGKFGKNIKKFSFQMIDANLAHFVASDAHNVSNRGFCFREGLREIEKAYGMDQVYYFTENAELLIEGKHIYKEIPEPIKRKKFLGIF